MHVHGVLPCSRGKVNAFPSWTDPCVYMAVERNVEQRRYECFSLPFKSSPSLPGNQPPTFASSTMLTTLGWKDSSLPSGSRPSFGKSQPAAMAHVPRSVAVHVVGTTTTPNYAYTVSSSAVYEPPRRAPSHSSSQTPRHPPLTAAVVMEHTISSSGWSSVDRKTDDGNYRILPNTYVPDAFVYERSIDSRSDTLTSYSSDSERDASLGGKTSSSHVGPSRRDSKRKSAPLAIANHSHNRDSVVLPHPSPPHSNSTSSTVKSSHDTSRPHSANHRREDYTSDTNEGAIQVYNSNLSLTRAGAPNGSQGGAGPLAVAVRGGGSPPTHDDARAGQSRPRTSSILSTQTNSTRGSSSSPTERVGKAVEVRRDRSSSGSSSGSHYDRSTLYRNEPRHGSPPRDGTKEASRALVPSGALPLHSVPINRPPPAGRRESKIIINTNCGPPITSRTVRFSENLICPSPIPPSRRRQGWYNKRGDQLWTNDGEYLPPSEGEEYPPDLNEYPDYGVGWMNEDGVRIDMQHRLIPKTPLRPALKRTGASASSSSSGSKSSADGRVSFAS